MKQTIRSICILVVSVAITAGVMLVIMQNALVNQNNAHIEETTGLENQVETLKALNSKLETENAELKAENSELNSWKYNYELSDKTEETAQDTAETVPSAVYEDEFISLSYCGIGTGASFPFADKQCVIFEVDNKTDTTFEFSSISIALDGQDIGYALCYSKITPKSKGNIYVIADEQSNITGKRPKEISGSVAVKDLLDMDVFGKDEWWHIISFSEIAI